MSALTILIVANNSPGIHDEIYGRPDPLAEKYYHISPYAYCAGDPVNLVDPDGRDPKRKWRNGTIIVSATIYTNNSSSKSAKQAAKFWNDRTSDTYKRNGKEYKIEYSITINEVDNASFELFKGRTDTYEVKPKGGVKSNGKTVAEKNTPKTNSMEVDKDYSEYKPGTTELSSTGAHEMGHYLGISEHESMTVMSKSQDEDRTTDVSQGQVDSIVESDRGTDDFLTKLLRFFGI